MAADNRNLHLRWIRAFNERDWATERACRTADYTAHTSGAPGPLDAAGWAAFMGAFTTAFPDAQSSVDDPVTMRGVDFTLRRWEARRALGAVRRARCHAADRCDSGVGLSATTNCAHDLPADIRQTFCL